MFCIFVRFKFWKIEGSPRWYRSHPVCKRTYAQNVCVCFAAWAAFVYGEEIFPFIFSFTGCPRRWERRATRTGIGTRASRCLKWCRNVSPNKTRRRSELALKLLFVTYFSFRLYMFFTLRLPRVCANLAVLHVACKIISSSFFHTWLLSRWDMACCQFHLIIPWITDLHHETNSFGCHAEWSILKCSMHEISWQWMVYQMNVNKFFDA